MQSGDHLHDLNLAVRLTSVNVASVGDQELDELAGRWGWKQGRVVLLGENESLVSHDDAVLIRQVLHVRRVGEAFDGDEQLAWEIKTLGNFSPSLALTVHLRVDGTTWGYIYISKLTI